VTLPAPVSTRAPVGLIGIGLIGTSLARRLRAAGVDVLGHDVNAARAAPLTAIGGRFVPSADALREACECVLVAVLDTDQVEAALEGPGGLRPRPGQTIVCVSTCDPERIAVLARRLAAGGVALLDMPLSGNSDQVALGKAVGLVGGDRAVAERVAPILDVIAPKRFHLGATGSGGRAKLAINLVGGLNRAAMAEGLAFADALGLDLPAFLDVLRGSAAYSRTMDNRGAKMVHGDFTPHARVAQSRKDFRLMQDYAARTGQALPLATVYLDLIEGCLAHGEGDLDNSAIIREVRRRRHPGAVGRDEGLADCAIPRSQQPG
jgi:3-hydroxyisobutyrate dehydrogenase-like beta-hydroxyacid dehydrogenase